MNDVDIQKFLEHLENIDKSLVTIAGALRSIAYDCAFYNYRYSDNALYLSHKDVNSIIDKEGN